MLNLILSTASKWLDRLASVLVFLLLSCMVIVISAGVFWRYGLNSALSWSEELGRFLLVWVSFLGATMATYRGSHIGINILFDRLPPGGQLWISRLVDCMMILFLGSVLFGGIKILPFVHFRVSPTLSMHMDIPYLIMPISSGIMIVHIVSQLVKRGSEQEGKK